MVSNRIKSCIVVVSSLLFVLTACAGIAPTEDSSAKITEIASTVQADLTKVAALTPSATQTYTPTVTATMVEFTPTLSTPMETATPTVGFGTATTGDNAQFDKDITIPDGSLIKPGATFQKTWSIINNGTTTWNKDYQLIYVDGTQTPVLMVKLNKDVAPGQSVQITINFVAPTALGSYVSWWQMYSASGFRFGELLSLRFTVGNETPTPTSNVPTSTAAVTETLTATTAP
jgi:hypothetical protein